MFLYDWPQLGLHAAGYDGSPIVRVATRVRGRWDARARLAHWTLGCETRGEAARSGSACRSGSERPGSP